MSPAWAFRKDPSTSNKQETRPLHCSIIKYLWAAETVLQAYKTRRSLCPEDLTILAVESSTSGEDRLKSKTLDYDSESPGSIPSSATDILYDLHQVT